MQVQVTLTSVDPVTVAVKVIDCETITLFDGGLTATVITLVPLPPPQPATARRTRALRLNKSIELNLCDFMTTRTPKIPLSPGVRREKRSLAFRRSVDRYNGIPRKTQTRQNVRLTVKRKVVFGSK